jgi:hypothetical protein
LPFLFSRQIEHENAVASNDEWSCEALYVLRSVWNVDGGIIGGTERLEKEANIGKKSRCHRNISQFR